MIVNDVLGQQCNLDSVIISYAGKYGTPPQFIKSQIQEETHFDPSYLYEPFEDLKHQTSRADSTRIYSNQYRIISSVDIGAPLPPTGHTNVHNVLGRTSYPGFGGTIWQYYDRYKKSLYARTNSKGAVVYESLNKIWRDSLFNPIKDSLAYNEHMTDASAKQVAEELANDSLPTYLRDVYRHGVMNILPAQTRIVASYGLMQMIYYYAFTERGYSVNDANLPENINLTDISLTYGLKHLQSKFQETGEDFYAFSGWKYGFEGTFQRALNRYSGRSTYGVSVLRNANDYLPKLK